MTALRRDDSRKQIVPLVNLAPGESGTIVDVDGRSDLVVRLHEMGVRPGLRVRMIRTGAACIVAIDNHRFAIRGDELAVVLVDVNRPVPVAR